MYVAPKYIFSGKNIKEQQISLSCFLDDGTDVTKKCKFELAKDNPEIKIVGSTIKVGKKPLSGINEIIVSLEEKAKKTQDFAILYIN